MIKMNRESGLGVPGFRKMKSGLIKLLPFSLRHAICWGIGLALIWQVAPGLRAVATSRLNPPGSPGRANRMSPVVKKARGLQGGTPIILYGPQQFDYQPGPARTIYREFTLPIDSSVAGAIRVQNGAPGGTNRVAGAIIQLNGTVLSTGRTLNQNTAALDIPATLQTSNSLSVRITGAPGSFLTVTALILTPLAITSLVPSSGAAGLSVMVNGAGFDPRTPNHNIVSFTRAGGGMTQAQVTAFSTTQLTVVVPADVATGPVTVQNDAGTATSPSNFTVAAPPAIADFNPKRGPEGTLVTITGSSLKPDANNPVVTFAGSNNTRLPAVVTFATDTEVRATVPAGAVSGPIGISNALGSALSLPIFNVDTLQDFQITLAPSSGMAVQGSTANYIVSLTSNQADFSQLAVLSITGLPAAMTASFTPQQLTAGANSTLALVVPGNVAASSYNFTIEAKAMVEGSEQTRTANGSLVVQQGGQTKLAGRVLSTQDEPVMGATVSIDGVTATTDAAGNFLMSGVAAGTDRPLMVDGRTASAPNRTYPVITEPVTIVANQVNIVPHKFFLPAIDVANEVTLVPGQTTVVTTPSVPGMSLTIPADAGLVNRDGTPVTRVSLTAVAIDRTPAPLPSNVSPSIVFTAQPGGARPAPGKVLPVIYPNLGGANPGTRIALWNFNHDTVQWYIYGYGNVSADGRSIVPEPGVGLPDFSWHFVPPPDPCDGGNCCKECPCPKSNNPVDLSSGVKIEKATDVSFSGARGGLTVERIHTSTLAGSCDFCPFGRGWTHNYAIRLTGAFAEGGTGRIFWPEESFGRLFNYSQKEADNTLVFTTTATPHQLGDVIRKLPNGTFEYRYKHGDLMRFDATGRLTALVDRNGNTTTLSYTGANLTQVTDAVGRSINFEYAGNRITRVTDPLNRSWSYTYDGNNRLIAVTDPLLQTMSYTYDTFSRISTIRDKREVVAKQIFYDGSGRVIEQRFPEGGRELYSYTLSGNVVTGVTVTDALGRAKSMRFNGSGQIIGTTDELGQTATINRDLSTNLKLETAGPCGCREEKRTYDSRGNVTEITDRLAQTTRYQYDPVFNHVTRVIDRLGRVTTYAYDSHGNRISMTNALNQTTSYNYDQFGQMISMTDALGHPTQMEYDALGNLTATVDPLNRRSTKEYDLVGRMTAMADPLNRRSEVTYDDLDRMVAGKDPNNAVTKYEYDVNGNVLSVTNALNRKWVLKYDARNLLLLSVDPLNRETRYEYDAAGQQIAMVSPAKRRMTYGYDARGRRVSMTDGLGGVIRQVYDNRNNLAAFTDQRNNTTVFIYDELFRNTAQIDPLGHKNEFSYDAEGNVLTTTDRLGRQTTMSYDSLNRLAAANYIDAAVNYTYDAAGRLTGINDSQAGTIATAYDDANQLSSEQTPQGLVSYTYNQAGQRASMTAADRPPVTYAYDAAGRLSTITQGGETFTFAYDALSRRQSLQRPNGVTTVYQYNEVNRLSRLTHTAPSAAVLEDLQYTYTVEDEIASINSLASATLLPAARTGTAANPANRIPQFGQASYLFDDEGQTMSATDTQGTANYTWDARGRLASVTLANGQTISYGYDALGRRTSRTAGGVTTSFLYDRQDVVRDIISGGIPIDYLNGLGLDQKLRQTGAGGNLYFLADHLGSANALTNASGGLVERRQYEIFGEGGLSALSRYGFTGRERDFGTGLYYYRARYYDPQIGRFLTEDPIKFQGGSNFYAYVGNNPVNLTDPLGLEEKLPDDDGSPIGPDEYDAMDKEAKEAVKRCMAKLKCPSGTSPVIKEIICGKSGGKIRCIARCECVGVC